MLSPDSKSSLIQTLFGGIKRKTWIIHISLFVVTFASMTLAHWHDFLGMKSSLVFALWYSVPLILILFAHEMGHYVHAKINGVDSSLPYFIPMPFLTGTMGAVIKLRSIPANNRALFDIAFWGPAMSFLLSLPALVAGLMLSHVQEIVPGKGIVIFGDSLLTKVLVETFFVLPPNHDVVAHPLFFAGWFGMLVTSINLMPLGQLDGGHLLYSLLGKRHKYIAKTAFVLLLVICLVSMQYIVWILLILFLIKVEHPDYTRIKQTVKFSESINIEMKYTHTKLNRARKVLGVLSFFVFIITFVPQPISEITISDKTKKYMNSFCNNCFDIKNKKSLQRIAQNHE